MIKLPRVVAGRAEQEPGYASAAVAVGEPGDDHDSTHALRIENSSIDRLLPRDEGRGVERGVFGDVVLVAVDPRTADVQIRPAGSGEGLDRRIDHRGVEVRARFVAGARRVDRPVRVAQQAQDRRPVVQVDDGRRRAALSDDPALGVVADEGGDLVAVLLKLGQDVRPDEPGCAGECHSHGAASPLKVVQSFA
jgi:hypothetical protein